MDTKINIKEEESLSDDLASQNGTEFFHEVVTMKREYDAVFLNDDWDMTNKTEIKSETAFPKLLIKTETVTSSNNWEIDRKIVAEEQTLTSDFGSQNEDLLEDPVMKDKKYNCDHEMCNKLEIKVEPWWLQTEAQRFCDDIKDGNFPPVKSSRLCTGVSGAVIGKSPLIAAEASERDTSFYPEYEHQNSVLKEMSTEEEHILSEQSGKCSEGEEQYIRPLHLKQKTLIIKSKRPYKCEICNKSFTHMSNLKRHYLFHNGKKPHKCKICNRGFCQSSDLKIHNLIHEGKKPHHCKTCDRCFTQLSHLKTHYLIHEGKKPHQCKTCDKSFTRLSHLKIHYLVHEGKKPHQCKTCDKSFTQLSHLKRHYLIHEGKKPHQCETCNKSFSQLSDLKRHYVIHESKK